jgi:aspartate racemase
METETRTLGLIGGMSWHSTATYYRLINEAVAAERGGHSSAKIVLQSLDFSEIRACQLAGDWARAGALLAGAARHCVDSGADVVAICTNLMHKVAPEVEGAIDVPLLHIADAVAAEGERRGWQRLGILGTRWVMEEPFYADRLARHGKQAVTPDAADRELVDRIVFDELTQGKVVESSRAAYLDVVGRLAEQGAEAVVLACTEIGLLIGPDDSPLPIIDSAEVHALELARAALAVPAAA